jgi:hypothetical protein
MLDAHDAGWPSCEANSPEDEAGPVLLELSVVEQRYHAVEKWMDPRRSLRPLHRPARIADVAFYGELPTADAG